MKLPAVMSCSRTGSMLAGVIVPVTVSPAAGQAGVPAGPLPRFVQRKA